MLSRLQFWPSTGERRGELRVGAGAGGTGVLEARVEVAAHVVPGPAEEAAFGDAGHVVGDEVVAEVVALVGGAPERAGDGVDGLADAVADAVGVDLLKLAVGGELEDVGAVELAGVGVGVVHIGAGADRDEQVFAVLGEDDVAGPVAAARELRVAGDDRNDGLDWSHRVQVARVIREALHAGGVANVDVLGVRAGGIEGDAEGVVEAGGEGLDGCGGAVGFDAAQDDELAGAGVGEEEVAVGRGADEARLGKGPGADAHVLRGIGALERGVVAAGVERDLEARGRDGPCAVGARDDVRLILDCLVRVGLGQVGEGDFVAHAGGLLVPVGEGGLAGEQGLLLGLHGEGGGERGKREGGGDEMEFHGGP